MIGLCSSPTGANDHPDLVIFGWISPSLLGDRLHVFFTCVGVDIAQALRLSHLRTVESGRGGHLLDCLDRLRDLMIS